MSTTWGGIFPSPGKSYFSNLEENPRGTFRGFARPLLHLPQDREEHASSKALLVVRTEHLLDGLCSFGEPKVGNTAFVFKGDSTVLGEMGIRKAWTGKPQTPSDHNLLPHPQGECSAGDLWGTFTQRRTPKDTHREYAGKE